MKLTHESTVILHITCQIRNIAALSLVNKKIQIPQSGQQPENDSLGISLMLCDMPTNHFFKPSQVTCDVTMHT